MKRVTLSEGFIEALIGNSLYMGTKPNILVILVDQLRRQALQCYGDQNIKTPAIDSLAREGVRFTNACSSFPVCVPFRFSLMTGQYPHDRFTPSIGYRMSPSENTLADEWNRAGYHTAYVGKWHLYGGGHGTLPDFNNIATNRFPVPRKHQGRWKKWLGFELANDHFDTCYFEDDDKTPKKIEGYQTDGLFDLAMKHLQERKAYSEPTACVLSVEPPHPPFEAPDELKSKWLKSELLTDPNFMVPDPSIERFEGWSDKQSAQNKDKVIRSEKLYYAMIENLDTNVRRMLDFLKREGLRENTIIVFMSDHGHCGGRHCWLQKSITYEESIGIPLIISDPGMKKFHGSVAHNVLGTEDLFPTLIGLTGLNNETVPGIDFSPIIRGEKVERKSDGILLEFTHIPRQDLPEFDKGWRGIRTDRYKYTVQGGIFEGGSPWQLFDLRNDPYELNNLVDVDTQLVEKLHRQLKNLLIESEDDYPLADYGSVSGMSLRQM